MGFDILRILFVLKLQGRFISNILEILTIFLEFMLEIL